VAKLGALALDLDTVVAGSLVPSVSNRYPSLRSQPVQQNGSLRAGSKTMFAKTKFVPGFAGLICIAVASTTTNASAVTAEVARKCSALTAKAFPPRQIGNPAAGSAKGTGADQRNYFRKCVANGGHMGHAAKRSK